MDVVNTSYFEIVMSKWLVELMKIRPSVNCSIGDNNCWLVSRIVMQQIGNLWLYTVKMYCLLYFFIIYEKKWWCLTMFNVSLCFICTIESFMNLNVVSISYLIMCQLLQRICGFESHHCFFRLPESLRWLLLWVGVCRRPLCVIS